jgi:hypothetical protein
MVSGNFSGVSITIFESSSNDGGSTPQEEPPDAKNIGVDYSPHGDKFLIKLTNKTDKHIPFVCLNILLRTDDGRHSTYIRRPLYRKGTESKQSHMTDHLDPMETTAEFYVNKTGPVNDENEMEWIEENNPVPIFEKYARKNRKKLYIIPRLEYRFEKETDHRITKIRQGFRSVKLLPVIKHIPAEQHLRETERISDNLIDSIVPSNQHNQALAGGVYLSLFSGHYFEDGNPPIYD